MAEYGFSTLTSEVYAKMTEHELQEHYARIRKIRDATADEMTKINEALVEIWWPEKEGKK